MEYTQFLGASVPVFAQGLTVSVLVIIAVIILLNGLALWKAARLKDTMWFWIMVLINSAGIIPLIYLIVKRNKHA